MKHARIKAVIFDIGGVVTEWDDGIVFRNLQRLTGRSRHDVEAAYRTPLGLLETGRITKKEFMRRVSALLHSRSVLNSGWLDGYVSRQKINGSVIKTVRALSRSGYTVATITNTSKSYYTSNKRRGVYDSFGAAFISCYLGVQKPEKRIFLYAQKKLKVRPEECIFIDDKPANAAGARSAGMRAIVFRNAAQMKRELRKYGIKI